MSIDGSRYSCYLLQPVAKKAKEVLRVYKEARDAFQEILDSCRVDRFEIGRSGDPLDRFEKKGYQHIWVVCGDFDCRTSAAIEQLLIEDFGGHPKYNRYAARHGGGGCPIAGKQFIYMVWDGEEFESGCSLHDETGKPYI